MPGLTQDRPAARISPGPRGKRAWWLSGIAGLAGATGAAGAILAIPASPPTETWWARLRQAPYKDLAVFGAAFHAVRTLAADERNDDQLVEAAIAGMVASLDPYSQYVTVDGLREFDEEDTGSYPGIGVEIGDGAKVQAAIPGGPAARAGLAPGTVIERIDGIEVDSLDRAKIVDLLRGEPGSTVRLRVVPPMEHAKTEMVLTREWLPLHPVRMRALGTVACVALDHFDDFTTGRLLKALTTLKAGIGPDRISGLVLDLRGNRGGLVVQAVAVAGAFLGRGEIVRLVGRGPNLVERFALDRGGRDLVDGLPLVVLVDGDTASAAEIVAGALQDHRRATVVGTRTYGKGAVQTTYTHRNGRGLRLTTAWVVTPAGRRVEGNGIEPDRVVTQESETGTQDGNAMSSSQSERDTASLQNGIVEDVRIEPLRDAQLRAALQHLGTLDLGR